MRRLVIVVGALVALAVVVAIAWTAPTVVVAAPLWVMALCVLTGYRPASEARLASDDGRAGLVPPPERPSVLPEATVRLTARRRRAS
jgi:hypothetical protein